MTPAMNLTMGIDIGTYETKGVLVDADGHVVAEARRKHEMIVPRAGWAEHDSEATWWGDVCNVSRALLEGVDPAAVRGLALSAIGPCMLPVDADNQPLMNGVLYGVDTRAQAEIEELNARIGADVILSRCGNALTSQSVGPKILWFRRAHPELWARTARIHTATSFVVERLTGEAVIDHYTAANAAPLYDADAQDWCFDLADDICDRGQLPRLMWSGEIAGAVTAAASQATGLAIGTPVTCGTIDAAAEAFSVGVAEVGDMMMMYGSTIFIISVTPERVQDARLWTAPWLFPGQHAAMAGLATSGTLTHWFRDTFARELPKETAFPMLVEEASTVPAGARGLLFLPYFSGERTPIHDPLAKGAFFGLNLTHGRAEMFRALIEGIAYGTAHVTECYAEAGAAPARIYAVGGGVQNALWLQATSDATGLDQIVRGVTLGASFGNAALARMAVDGVEAEVISAWNPVVREVVARSVPAYAHGFGLWKRLYVQTRDIMAELGAG